MNLLRRVLPVGVVCVAVVSAAGVLPACGDEGTSPIGEGTKRPGSSSFGSNGSNGNNEELPQGLSACLPTCTQNDECRDCSDGMTVCDAARGLCIACGPNANGKTCPSGKSCSDYGYCVPAGQSCPSDANGVPTIECNDDAACAACSPDHRVCDTVNKKCVKCKPGAPSGAGSLCQATEVCSAEGTCERKCPQGCVSDDQCGKCEDGKGNKAPVCTRGACGECNPTRPEAGGCGAGEKCGDNGRCEPKCGDNGNAPLECASDADCSRCSDVVTEEDNGAEDPDGPKGVVAAAKWMCKKDNGQARGKCAPQVGAGDDGCKALGAQILPKPFSSVTALCESDDSCSGVGVNFNVGGLLGNLTQLPGIQSGVLAYPMKRCAKMEIVGRELPCGVCVPCKEDNDCSDIDIMNSVGSIFGPVGSLVSRVLSSAIFGDDPPIVHMTCSKVFGDFGACVPCPSFFSACGDKANANEGDAGPDGGNGGIPDNCSGRERGWYCASTGPRAAFFCDNGNLSGGYFYCPSAKPNCQASGPGIAPAKTESSSESDAKDGKLPLCTNTADPHYPSRHGEDGEAQGALP